MEKLYSVLHSTFVLCLFLGILLLGKANSTDSGNMPRTVATQKHTWENLEISAPFSWPALKSLVGLNLLPVYQEKVLQPTNVLDYSFSYTSSPVVNQNDESSLEQPLYNIKKEAAKAHP